MKYKHSSYYVALEHWQNNMKAQIELPPDWRRDVDLDAFKNDIEIFYKGNLKDISEQTQFNESDSKDRKLAQIKEQSIISESIFADDGTN